MAHLPVCVGGLSNKLDCLRGLGWNVTAPGLQGQTCEAKRPLTPASWPTQRAPNTMFWPADDIISGLWSTSGWRWCSSDAFRSCRADERIAGRRP
ncbi:hypothetical protein VDGL01_05636 [Verticillium dahliae]